MSNSFTLINLSNLSKPATVLVEKICNAFGLYYEPTHAKRMAEAEVEVAKIRARGNLEVTEIQERAIYRLIHEEGKKQENIESITAQATTRIDEHAKPENVKDDWISHFFEKCRIVSDAEMQKLWSTILAGEANKPGSYSKRTIDIISTLDKSDAHIFTNLCGFAITDGKGIAYPLVFEHQDNIYKKSGLDFASLNHLDFIGLIKFNELGNYMFTDLPKQAVFLYFGQVIKFIFQNDSDNQLDSGHVMLTQAGLQLASICGAQMNREFLNYMAEYYKKKSVQFEVIGGSNK